jgi:hypothetical protein
MEHLTPPPTIRVTSRDPKLPPEKKAKLNVRKIHLYIAPMWCSPFSINTLFDGFLTVYEFVLSIQTIMRK